MLNQGMEEIGCWDEFVSDSKHRIHARGEGGKHRECPSHALLFFIPSRRWPMADFLVSSRKVCPGPSQEGRDKHRGQLSREPGRLFHVTAGSPAQVEAAACVSGFTTLVTHCNWEKGYPMKFLCCSLALLAMGLCQPGPAPELEQLVQTPQPASAAPAPLPAWFRSRAPGNISSTCQGRISTTGKAGNPPAGPPRRASPR